MNVILLSSKASEFSVNVARCLGEAGISVVIIGVDSCKGSVLSSYCNAFYQVPMHYFEIYRDSLIKLVNEVAAHEKCDVVIPICVPAECFLSSNREKFAAEIRIMPLSKPELIQKLNNKWDFYCSLKELDLAVPCSILLTNLEQAKDVQFDFPALTKPLTGTGSQGICYYLNKVDFLNRIPAEYPVLMQELIPGWDIGVSLYSIDGKIQATTTHRANDGEFIFLENEEALALCRKVVDAVKYTGLANFDLRYDERDGKIKCLECNPRPWGTIYAACQAGLNFPVLVWEASRKSQSSIPMTVRPQWIPNPRSIWFKNPRKALSQWNIVLPFTKKYIQYIRSNGYYEFYRILSDHKPQWDNRWFRFLLKYSKLIQNKYIRIED